MLILFACENSCVFNNERKKNSSYSLKKKKRKNVEAFDLN